MAPSPESTTGGIRSANMPHRKAPVWLWAIAVVLGVILAVTNPTRAEFLNWLNQRYVQDHPGDDGTTAALEFNQVTSSENYLLCTVFEMHFPDGSSGRVLGVGKQFIRLGVR